MSFEGIFKLELFRDGKEFLTQHYDTMPIARRAGILFMSTTEEDGVLRGFRLTDTRFGLEVLKKGRCRMPDSKIRLSVDELPWLVIGKHSDDHWYTAAAFLSDYAAECYVKDFRAVGIGDYKVINRSDINDKYKVL